MDGPGGPKDASPKAHEGRTPEGARKTLMRASTHEQNLMGIKIPTSWLH